MGLLLTLGYHQIPQNRKTAILQIPSIKTKRDNLSFLGLTACFRIWIPNYSIITKSLYFAARGDPDEPLPCPKGPSNPFYLFFFFFLLSLQTSFIKAPALSIPNPDFPDLGLLSPHFSQIYQGSVNLV
jgi:hypothetical protein